MACKRSGVRLSYAPPAFAQREVQAQPNSSDTDGSMSGKAFKATTNLVNSHGHRMRNLKTWQWPNLIAIDAALIALAWLATSAEYMANPVSMSAYIVLGLSVWLTYMADRLFDVAQCTMEQLHSARHRFSKLHFKFLWAIWGLVLISNLTIAFTGLSHRQLSHGGILLALCLAYTLLNQLLSRRFFPKEICVSIIFAGGVIVFLTPPFPWLEASTFASICLINCLMISNKEAHIDAAMHVRAINQLPARHLVTILIVLSAVMLLLIQSEIAISLGATLAILTALQISRRLLAVETFRVLTDSALLVGPAVALLQGLSA